MNEENKMPCIEIGDLLRKLKEPGKIRIDIAELNLFFVPIVYYFPIGKPIEALGVIVSGDDFIAAKDLHDLKTELHDLIGHHVEINIPDNIPLHPVLH